MFATPVDFNWYSSVTSYYGYRIHPISGANQLHNGMDIGAQEGTKVIAGLTGTVTTSAYNDSYGNYVVIKDSNCLLYTSTSETRSNQKSFGLNYQKTGKQLMTEDEIAVMDLSLIHI